MIDGTKVDFSELHGHVEPQRLHNQRENDASKIIAEIMELDVVDVVSTRWHKYYHNDSGNKQTWIFGDLGRENEGYLNNAERFIEHIHRGVPSDKAMQAYEKCQSAIEGKLAAVMHEIPNIRRHRVLRDEGENVDVERYYSRDIECWESITRHSAKKRAICLGINFLGHCGQREEYFVNLTAGAAALTDVLVNKGYSVKLVGSLIWEFESGCPKPQRYLKASTFFGTYWKMTDFGHRVDGVSLLPYANPATLRYLGFHINAGIWPWCPKNPGYGRVTEIEPDVIALMGVDQFITGTPGQGIDSFAHSIANQAGDIVKLLAA